MVGIVGAMTQRVGFFGGTFDPLHIAHLILSEFAADALALDTMLFLPSPDPGHKQGVLRAAAEHRLAMLRLAIEDNPRFELSSVDIDRPGPHYSVDTVRILQTKYPEAELIFIIGADSLLNITSWYQPALLIQLCRFAVLPRPGVVVDAAVHEGVLPGLAERVTFLDAPLIEISSTDIADRLRTGRSVRYLVPPHVLDYIHYHNLYRD